MKQWSWPRFASKGILALSLPNNEFPFRFVLFVFFVVILSSLPRIKT